VSIVDQVPLNILSFVFESVDCSNSSVHGVKKSFASFLKLNQFFYCVK